VSPQPSGLLGRHAEQGPAVELVTGDDGKAATWRMFSWPFSKDEHKGLRRSAGPYAP
jgi:hypothetical protein